MKSGSSGCRRSNSREWDYFLVTFVCVLMLSQCLVSKKLYEGNQHTPSNPHYYRLLYFILTGMGLPMHFFELSAVYGLEGIGIR